MKKSATFAAAFALTASLFTACLALSLPKSFSASAAVEKSEAAEMTELILRPSDTASPNVIAQVSLGMRWTNHFVFGVVLNRVSTYPLNVRMELRGSETYYSVSEDMPILATGLASNLPTGEEVVAGIKGDVSRYYVVVAYINDGISEKQYKSNVVHYDVDGKVLTY